MTQPARKTHLDEAVARRTRRRAKRLRDLAASTEPFVCGRDGCTFAYATENGRAQHWRWGHGVRGRRVAMGLSDAQAAAHAAKIDRLRSVATRGPYIDTTGLLDKFLEALRKRDVA